MGDLLFLIPRNKHSGIFGQTATIIKFPTPEEYKNRPKKLSPMEAYKLKLMEELGIKIK